MLSGPPLFPFGKWCWDCLRVDVQDAVHHQQLRMFCPRITGSQLWPGHLQSPSLARMTTRREDRVTGLPKGTEAGAGGGQGTAGMFCLGGRSDLPSQEATGCRLPGSSLVTFTSCISTLKQSPHHRRPFILITEVPMEKKMLHPH